MKNILIITMLLLGAVLTGYAQQTAQPAAVHNFSLQDCINYAYQHQDSVKNAALDVTSAEYKVKETIGTGLPQINGTASFQDYLRIPTQLGPAGLFKNPPTIDPNAPLAPFPFGALKYNNTYSITATQLLFSGTFLVGLQAAKTYKELSQRSLVRSKIQTNVSVTKAYYQVLVSNEQIKLLDANINQLKTQLDQTTQQ
ncbi:MAG: TolC family protein, partial [Bacteroidetes bacterium]|nr:TolC family protein [Bacteroidota bacterium]